jgi:hypothetical protein
MRGVAKRGISMLAAAFVLWSCHSAASPAAPTGSSGSTSVPPAAPSAVREWSGHVDFSSASPSGSCEAQYVQNHPESFAQSAHAELQINEKFVHLTLRTYGGQICVFSGPNTADALVLSAFHETCQSYPLSVTAIQGIQRTCHTIAPAGDGPLWGQGTLIAQMNGSAIDGDWSYEISDPGSLGNAPMSQMRFTVDLRISLNEQSN